VGFDRHINYYKIQVAGTDGFLKGGRESGVQQLWLTPRPLLLRHPPAPSRPLFPHPPPHPPPQYATLCIRENPGCMFIATNRDAVTHLTDAQEWAGNGSMVGAIVGSTKREPHVVGKPSDFMLKNIAAQFSLKPEQICMVGDRLDTDIMFGQNGGLTTCLVLSGVTTEEQLLAPSNTVHPDFYMGQLSDLLEVKSSATVPA
jgi:phosphoglycolate phosphatase